MDNELDNISSPVAIGLHFVLVQRGLQVRNAYFAGDGILDAKSPG